MYRLIGTDFRGGKGGDCPKRKTPHRVAPCEELDLAVRIASLFSFDFLHVYWPLSRRGLKIRVTGQGSGLTTYVAGLSSVLERGQWHIQQGIGEGSNPHQDLSDEKISPINN